MKKATLLLVLTFVLLVPSMNANIIVIEPDRASIKVQLTNLSDFPDIALIYFFKGQPRRIIGSHSIEYLRQVGQLSANELITMYGSDPWTFYVVKKEYLDKVNMDSIDWSTNTNAQKLNLSVKTTDFLSEVYSAVWVDFKLARKNNTYYVYKSRTAHRFRGTKPDSVVKFVDEVVDITKPITVDIKKVGEKPY